MTAAGLIVMELIVKYGIPGAIAIMKALDKENITVEDLEKLRDLVKHPDEYLEKGKV